MNFGFPNRFFIFFFFLKCLIQCSRGIRYQERWNNRFFIGTHWNLCYCGNIHLPCQSCWVFRWVGSGSIFFHASSLYICAWRKDWYWFVIFLEQKSEGDINPHGSIYVLYFCSNLKHASTIFSVSSETNSLVKYGGKWLYISLYMHFLLHIAYA